jgi:hypothetical protein
MKTTLASLEALVATQAAHINNLEKRLTTVEHRSKLAAVSYLKDKDRSSKPVYQKTPEQIARREAMEAARAKAIATGQAVSVTH